MSQHFNRAVDQVAAGNINNFMGPVEDKEPLSTAQRKRLNAHVVEASEFLEIEARDIWREVVHTQIGVDSINEIQRSQFALAIEIVDNFRETERIRVNTRMMVSRITSQTKEKKIYEERDAFCLRTFGERHLNHMNIDQLRQVLAYVEDFEVAQEPVKNGFDYSISGIASVVTDYPLHFAATLALGAIAGKILL